MNRPKPKAAAQPPKPTRDINTYSLPEMMMNLSRVILIAKDQEYIVGVRTLRDDGMDDSVDVPKVRKIYDDARHVRNLVRRVKQEKLPGNLQLPALGKMVMEMNDDLLSIVEEKDREFIQGVAMLVEMNHAIAPSVAQQVKDIYVEYHQNHHRAQVTRD